MRILFITKIYVFILIFTACGSRRPAEKITIENKSLQKETTPSSERPSQPTARPEKQELNQWVELNQEVLMIEEQVNNRDFGGLERLEKILKENQELPNHSLLQHALEKWKQEQKWMLLSLKIQKLENKLKGRDYEAIEAVQKILEENPHYPQKKIKEEILASYRAQQHWEEITKQLEWSEFFLNKGDFKDLEQVKKVIKENPDYPRKEEFEKKIRLWDHELFLQTVPL